MGSPATGRAYLVFSPLASRLRLRPARLGSAPQPAFGLLPALPRRTLQLPPSVLFLLAAHAMQHSSPRSPGQCPIPPARGALEYARPQGCLGRPGFSPSCRGSRESDFVMKTPSTTPFACFRDRKLVPVVTSGSWAESGLWRSGPLGGAGKRRARGCPGCPGPSSWSSAAKIAGHINHSPLSCRGGAHHGLSPKPTRLKIFLAHVSWGVQKRGGHWAMDGSSGCGKK